jgi:hypothetical protein
MEYDNVIHKADFSNFEGLESIYLHKSAKQLGYHYYRGYSLI